MKLNLGCGEYPLVDFINIDFQKLPGANIVADITALPFGDNTFDKIYAGHCLEHLEKWKVALAEWRRVLKPMKEIIIVIPDTIRAISLFAMGRINEQLLLDVVYGREDVTFHKSIWWASRLAQAMAEVGFRKLKLVEKCPYMVAEVKWQSGIRGVK